MPIVATIIRMVAPTYHRGMDEDRWEQAPPVPSRRLSRVVSTSFERLVFGMGLIVGLPTVTRTISRGTVTRSGGFASITTRMPSIWASGGVAGHEVIDGPPHGGTVRHGHRDGRIWGVSSIINVVDETVPPI